MLSQREFKSVIRDVAAKTSLMTSCFVLMYRRDFPASGISPPALTRPASSVRTRIFMLLLMYFLNPWGGFFWSTDTHSSMDVCSSDFNVLQLIQFYKSNLGCLS